MPPAHCSSLINLRFVSRFRYRLGLRSVLRLRLLEPRKQGALKRETNTVKRATLRSDAGSRQANSMRQFTGLAVAQGSSDAFTFRDGIDAIQRRQLQGLVAA